MTLLLLTAEAGTVFGVTVWVLLRIWARTRDISLADVDFYDPLAETGHPLAGTGQECGTGMIPAAITTTFSEPAGSRRPGSTDTAADGSGQVGRIRLPRSPSAGPWVMDENGVAGFARSPLGAVIGAVNIAFQVIGMDGVITTCRRIATQQQGADLRECSMDEPRRGSGHWPAAESGSGTDPRRRGNQVNDSDRKEDHGSTGRAVGNLTRRTYEQIEITGWKLESYSSGNATVRYVLTRFGGGDDVVSVTMRVEVNWADGDWRVVAPPTGEWFDAFSADGDMSGFILFPAHVTSLSSPRR
ncbi:MULTISPECIES: hypothetical protein [unclassified Frankia]|uniref:hypothetical protein n=1 Tax=unclassified Frankia TaxID=2632575 RepID=UPI000B1F2270|nr:MULTISPECIES: hypothetical protein [unclassified Frankia]